MWEKLVIRAIQTVVSCYPPGPKDAHHRDTGADDDLSQWLRNQCRHRGETCTCADIYVKLMAETDGRVHVDPRFGLLITYPAEPRGTLVRK